MNAWVSGLPSFSTLTLLNETPTAIAPLVIWPVNAVMFCRVLPSITTCEALRMLDPSPMKALLVLRSFTSDTAAPMPAMPPWLARAFWLASSWIEDRTSNSPPAESSPDAEARALSARLSTPTDTPMPTQPPAMPPSTIFTSSFSRASTWMSPPAWIRAPPWITASVPRVAAVLFTALLMSLPLGALVLIEVDAPCMPAPRRLVLL